MRVAINSRSFLNLHYTGIGRYAYNLVKSLTTIDPSNRYVLYVPRKPFDHTKRVPDLKAPNLTYHHDWFKRGPHTIPRVDIYHSPSPDVIRPMKAKVVVTVHDLVYKAFSQGHTETTLRLTDEQIKSFLPFVSKVICCSENTRRDLHRFFDVDHSKTCVVHQGIDQSMFYPMDETEKKIAAGRLKEMGMIGPYLLFVGTIEPRKNLKGLLRAYADVKASGKFGGKLVVAGMKGWKSDDLTDFLSKLGVRNDVIFLGFVTDQELRYLYGMCAVFVFPSFYEGFGYPILEAMSCGAPVISSKAASCPEVSGEAAVLIDPEWPDQIAFAVQEVINNLELRRELSNKSIKRAGQFSFEKTARETLAVYQGLD